MIAACLITSSYSFMPSHAHIAHRNSQPTLLKAAAAEKPQELTDWGMDDDLWATMPGGAVRDLKRFVRTGEVELAQRRIETLIEISLFRTGSATDELTWFQAADAWEADNRERKMRAKEEAKAKKKAESEAAREVAEKAAAAATTPTPQ